MMPLYVVVCFEWMIFIVNKDYTYTVYVQLFTLCGHENAIFT